MLSSNGANSPALAYQGVTVAYGSRLAIEDVTCALGRGQFIGLIGPNGSGKSTLLKATLGLLPLRQGAIQVLGRRIDQVRSEVAYLPQREEVDWDFPATVADVVMMGRTGKLGWFRRPRRRDHKLVGDALERVGLAERAGSQIGQVSGGQQQRVFLARALVQEAQLLILDEPLAGVDAHSQDVILRVLHELAAGGQTVLLSVHDLDVAAAHCDQILCLNRRLIAYGPAAETLTPAILRQTYAGRVLVLSDPPHSNLAVPS